MFAGGSFIVSEHKNSGKEDLEHKAGQRPFHPGQLITEHWAVLGPRRPPAHWAVDSDAQQFTAWKVQFNDLE